LHRLTESSLPSACPTRCEDLKGLRSLPGCLWRTRPSSGQLPRVQSDLRWQSAAAPRGSTAPYSNAHRESGRKIEGGPDASVGDTDVEQWREGPGTQQEEPVAPW